MAFRFNFHINGEARKLVMTQGTEETRENLVLRALGCVLFWSFEPKVELSPKNPALAQTEFRPDFIALNEAGEVALWGECGNTSLNKLDKLTRRYPHARIVAIRVTEAQALKMRRDIDDDLERGKRIEILAFRDPADFVLWRDAVDGLTEIFGESTERSINLVINNTPLAADLVAY